VEVDLESQRGARRGRGPPPLWGEATGNAGDLPVRGEEIRKTARMAGGDLVGFDGDVESVRLRDPTDRVDDIGGFGPAALAPDAGQLRVAGDDARVVVGLVR